MTETFGLITKQELQCDLSTIYVWSDFKDVLWKPKYSAITCFSNEPSARRSPNEDEENQGKWNDKNDETDSHAPTSGTKKQVATTSVCQPTNGTFQEWVEGKTEARTMLAWQYTGLE